MILPLTPPTVTVPSDDENALITDAIVIAAELLCDETRRFIAQAKAPPPDSLAGIVGSLDSAATWLRAWAAIVDHARKGLIAADAA